MLTGGTNDLDKDILFSGFCHHHRDICDRRDYEDKEEFVSNF